MSLVVDVKVTFRKQLDLHELVQGEYINEDELVEAIESNNPQRIVDLLENINVNNHNFLAEINSFMENGNPSERIIEIKYNGQTIKANI